MHRHPFESLEVPVNQEPLPREVLERWVQPLYMEMFSGDVAQDEVVDTIIALWPDMTEEMARRLLGSFNWRTRIVGAYIAALKDLRSMTELIGRLLLRSDVCYAASGYCVALVHFNTPESLKFILEYLDYYLTRVDLWFDQNVAMGAIAHLDAQNATHNLESMMDKWRTFVADKPRWDLKRYIAAFGRRMTRFDAVSARCASASR